MAEQVPFGADVELANNPEPRCPCVLILDVSRSMGGEPIRALREGLEAYHDELMADGLARQRVEVAVVTFGGTVEVACPFRTAEQFQRPELKVKGDTPMGAAIKQGIDLVVQRKQEYRDNGIPYFRPWIFLFTDGGPTDDWKWVTALVKEGEQNRSFAFFAVGVEGANFDVLRQIASEARPPLKLDGLRFRDMFVWLSRSQRSVSHSKPGEEAGVEFTNPTAPGGWASLG